MAQKNKTVLKTYFETGKKPTQEQFWDLIESYFHKDEPITLEELSLLKANLATIDKNSDGIETLGNVDTKEQVNAKIDSAINTLKANAPEAYDTLKEIADYIANDSNAEAALLQLINTKLEKPVMTNNYYGLWDDANKKFVNGKLRTTTYNGKKPLVYNVENDNNIVASLMQVGGVNTSGFPTDKAYMALGDVYGSNRFVVYTQVNNATNSYDNFYSILNAGNSTRSEAALQALYIDSRDSSLKTSYIAARVFPNYNTEIKIYSENFITFSKKDGNLLTYANSNDYWEFFKPIKGANIKEGLKLIPPASVTPQPNMLIPKADGSGLIWYNNNRVATEIGSKLRGYAENIENASSIAIAKGKNSIAIGVDTTATSDNVLSLGNYAGRLSPDTEYSNNIGFGAGGYSEGSYNSNFIGYEAGNGAMYSQYSNFIGNEAGYESMHSYYSNFIGNKAGNDSSGSYYSNFIGNEAGYGSRTSYYSNFIGNCAGSRQYSSYSNFIGYNAGMAFTGNNLKSNNIIIGTNITLPNEAENSINIGGIIFGIGAQSDITGDPKVLPAAKGKIGIGVVSPTEKLEVAGNIKGNNLIIGENGGGIILKSPDGSKAVKISIDNSGNLVTTLL